MVWLAILGRVQYILRTFTFRSGFRGRAATARPRKPPETREGGTGLIVKEAMTMLRTLGLPEGWARCVRTSPEAQLDAARARVARRREMAAQDQPLGIRSWRSAELPEPDRSGPSDAPAAALSPRRPADHEYNKKPDNEPDPLREAIRKAAGRLKDKPRVILPVAAADDDELLDQAAQQVLVSRGAAAHLLSPAIKQKSVEPANQTKPVAMDRAAVLAARRERKEAARKAAQKSPANVLGNVTENQVQAIQAAGGRIIGSREALVETTALPHEVVNACEGVLRRRGVLRIVSEIDPAWAIQNSPRSAVRQVRTRTRTSASA